MLRLVGVAIFRSRGSIRVSSAGAFTRMSGDDVPNSDDDVPELGCGERYTSGGLQNIANSPFESRVFRLEGSFIKVTQVGNGLGFGRLPLLLTIW